MSESFYTLQAKIHYKLDRYKQIRKEIEKLGEAKPTGWGNQFASYQNVLKNISDQLENPEEPVDFNSTDPRIEESTYHLYTVITHSSQDISLVEKDLNAGKYNDMFAELILDLNDGLQSKDISISSIDITNIEPCEE